MNRSTAFDTLAQDFATWMAATYPALAGSVAYPDIDFLPPPHPGSWLRWNLMWSGTLASGAGDLMELHTGMAMIELYWPSGQGYGAINTMGDAIADHYRRLTFDQGRLKCTGVNDGNRPYVSSPPGEPGYARRTVNVPIRLFQPR
jgi:hypothetical protein